MPARSALVAAIRAELAAQADPDRAPGMQTYMKSAMPYLGVRVPQVRAIVRRLAKATPPRSADDLVAAVRTLWDDATYREQRYAATALLDVPAARPLRTPQHLDLYAYLIVDGAWWDHVDEVSHRVGELLIQFPNDVDPEVRGWTTADDRWLRRSSVICQVGAKRATDVTLLTDAIEANATDRDFFLRKAIGWALRDYARTDPDWVRAFVATHDLAPLSVREATKHLG